MSRRPIIAGNWKMNMTRAQATELITALKPLVKDAAAEVVICVPYTDIDTAVALCKGSNIKVGAENVAWAEKGAWRIPEAVLFGFSFFLGGVGGLLGMIVCRHKTKHVSFCVLIPLFAVLSAAAVVVTFIYA